MLTAADNDNPLRYLGPVAARSYPPGLVRRQLRHSRGFPLGLIGHFYSPLSKLRRREEYGIDSNPLPGTNNGAFLRRFGLAG